MPKPPLICPKQDVPPADTEPKTLFGKTWWLFFHNLTAALKSLVDALSGLTLPVSVPNGGTGAESLAAHGVLIGEGLASVNVSGAGTAGQLLTSNGASADPSFQNPVAVDSNTVLVGASSGTFTCGTGYVDVPGLTVTLNKNGTWMIRATLDIQLDNSALAVFGELLVGGATLTPNDLVHATNNIAGTIGGTYSQEWPYVNSGSTIAKIHAKCAFSGTATISGLNSKLVAIFLHT